MGSLINLILEQRLILLLIVLASLLLIASIVLVLVSELRARARRRQRQREREEREAQQAEQAQEREVDEAIEDALATILPVAPALPNPAAAVPEAAAPVPAAAPAEGAAIVTVPAGDGGTAGPQVNAVNSGAVTTVGAAPAEAGTVKPKIAVDLFGAKPAEAPRTEAPKPEAPKAEGGSDNAFGELFTGVFDDEAAARMQMMLSASEPVTMEALADLSHSIRRKLSSADEAMATSKDEEPS